LAADPAAATALHDLGHRLAELDAALDGLLIDVDDLPLDSLGGDLAALTSPATQVAVRAAAPPLRDLATASDGVLLALRRLDAEPDQIGYAVAAASLQEARATAPVLDRMDGGALARQLDRVTAALPALRRANADVIIARLRQRFLDNVQH